MHTPLTLNILYLAAAASLLSTISAQETSTMTTSAVTQISDGQIQAPAPTPETTSLSSYSNPSEQYTSLTNSLGVITGQPSVITSQPSVITSQPSVITSQDPVATFESSAPGIPVNTTIATVTLSSSSVGSGVVGNLSTSTSTRVATATQTQTRTGAAGTSTGTGFEAPESTGAAVKGARVEAVGSVVGIAGVVFAMVL